MIGTTISSGIVSMVEIAIPAGICISAAALGTLAIYGGIAIIRALWNYRRDIR